MGEEFETCAGPALLAPAGEAEDEGHVGKFDGVETRVRTALEVDVDAVGEGQEAFDEFETAAAPGANDARFGVIVLNAAEWNGVFPGFEDEFGFGAGEEFVAE